MTSSSARVSIIIPTHNVERYISECVDSCLSQQSDLVREVIIAENNSTDRTPDIAQGLVRSHPSLIRLVTCPKRGASAARNAGLAIATGEWIQFLDADDLLLPGKLRHQIGLIERSKNSPSAVLGSYLKLYANGQQRTVRSLGENPYQALLWGHGRCGITSSNLWRRDLLTSIGGLDEHHTSSQETNLLFTLLQAGATVTWDDAPLCIIRQRPEGGQISRGNRDQLVTNFFKLRREVILSLQQSAPELLKRNPYAAAMYRSFVKLMMSRAVLTQNVDDLSFLLANFHRPTYQRFPLSAAKQFTLERIVHSLARRLPRRIATLLTR